MPDVNTAQTFYMVVTNHVFATNGGNMRARVTLFSVKEKE